MLPGFRFLFAAIVLSMSILIFGLGVAALLRAAHEEFANLPSRRSTPEPMFARRTDEPPPTLALLRIDVPEEKPAETAPAAPALEAIADTPAPAQSPDTATVEPETLAVVKATEAPSEPQSVEASQPGAATEAAAPASPAPATETVGQAELKVAAIDPTPELAEAALPPPPSPASDVYSLEDNPAASRIATLGGPAVIVDEKAAAAALGIAAASPEAKPDRAAIRKREAERARERRQIAARRARVAREAALAQQQLQANPFTQLPFPTNPTRQIQ